MSLGARIREAREAKNWSQQRLADEAGVSQTTIDKIEQGITRRSKFLGYIAKALGTSVQELDPEYAAEMREAWNIDPDTQFAFNAGRTASWLTIPLFVAEPETVTNEAGEEITAGAFSISKKPVDRVACPPMLINVPRSYALYIAQDAMMPEFGPGDIACINPQLPPIPMSTCLFGANSDAVHLRVLGRLVNDPKGQWEVFVWRGKGRSEDTVLSFFLPKKRWKLAHRVVAKYYRA